jgi:hypothetical protein
VTMSAGKVKIVNRVLQNLLMVLDGERDAEYLEALDDDDLPRVSDAVLVMVQFKSALDLFKSRHYKHVFGNGHHRVTSDFYFASQGYIRRKLRQSRRG